LIMEPRLSRELRLPRFRNYFISEPVLGSDLCSVCKNRERCMRLINDALRKLGIESFTLLVHSCKNYKPAGEVRKALAI